MTEAKRMVAMTVQAVTNAKGARLRTAMAKEEFDKCLASFKKYDSDKDGKLSRREIQAFSKGEYSFTIPSEGLDMLCEVLIDDGAKGVPLDDWHSVKMAVGLEREKARNVKRREAREAKER